MKSFKERGLPRAACPERSRGKSRGPVLSERSESKGFTLIELLLVISIIIIIASLVIVSVSKARERGRDAKRVADLAQIQLALEMYRDAHGGVYPATRFSTGTSWVKSNNICGIEISGGFSGICNDPSTANIKVTNWDTTGSTTSLTSVLQTYLFPLPKDPLNTKTYMSNDNVLRAQNYIYGATETNYKLRVHLEEDTATMVNDGGSDVDNYEIFTLGAKNWGTMVP